MSYSILSPCIFIGISLVVRICSVFIGVGLADEMFFQSLWQVAVSVNKADIEIRIFQIPELCIWTKARALAVMYIIHLFVLCLAVSVCWRTVCLHAFTLAVRVCCFRQEV